MNEIRMTITTDLGDVCSSQWSPATDDELGSIKHILGKFDNLDSLNITTEDDRLIYFNPRHVVSAQIESR